MTATRTQQGRGTSLSHSALRATCDAFAFLLWLALYVVCFAAAAAVCEAINNPTAPRFRGARGAEARREKGIGAALRPVHQPPAAGHLHE